MHCKIDLGLCGISPFRFSCLVRVVSLSVLWLVKVDFTQLFYSGFEAFSLTCGIVTVTFFTPLRVMVRSDRFGKRVFRQLLTFDLLSSSTILPTVSIPAHFVISPNEFSLSWLISPLKETTLRVLSTG